MLAEAFYRWIQAKNEADVEMEEKLAKASKQYDIILKRRVLNRWKLKASRVYVIIF